MICPKGAVTYKPRATPWEICNRNRISPERAKHNDDSWEVAPFQGSCDQTAFFPRALPWAIMLSPFRRKVPPQVSQTSFRQSIQFVNLTVGGFYLSRTANCGFDAGLPSSPGGFKSD